MISRWTKIRIACLGLGLGGLGLAVAKRGFELQMQHMELPGAGKRSLKDFAEAQYLKEIELPPRRGRILDRGGQELAATAEFDSVACNPRQLAHVPEGAKRLAKALGTTERELRRRLAGKERRFFAWVQRRVSPQTAAAVRALKIPGVTLEKEPYRVYPFGPLAATVLGHAGKEGGLDGVEKAYERHLKGAPAKVQAIQDGIKRKLIMGGLVDSSVTAGKDIVLSLDRRLTHLTETALAEVVKAHNAKGATAVMMDPRTGHVLAMASVPTYDPNDPKDVIKLGARNRALTDTFEPGSTMKAFTLAAALDAGRVRPNDFFDCEMGRFKVGKHTIKDTHPNAILTAAEVFQHSSNIGTVKIARKLKKEELRAAFVRYGFGKRTGIFGEKSGITERNGIIHPASKWGEIHFATNAFGQGLTVTPLQIVAGYAAIAAGGIYRAPRLALEVVSPDGTREPLPLPPGARTEEQVMKPKTARTMLEIMRTVTQKGGTAQRAAIPGYPTGGKTGTAQKVVGGRYAGYIASFIGVVPINDPRIVLGVFVDEPEPEHRGGMVAAPVFKQIAEQALRYLAVPPSEAIVPLDEAGQPLVAKETKGAKPAKDAKSDKLAKSAAAKAGAKGAALAKEAVAGVDAEEGPGIDELAWTDGEDGSDAALADGPEGDEAASRPGRADLVRLPSFAGMSLGEAIRAARLAGVELDPEGSGVASVQVPERGPVARGTVCRVTFRPPGS